MYVRKMRRSPAVCETFITYLNHGGRGEELKWGAWEEREYGKNKKLTILSYFKLMAHEKTIS
jgi:hypothetical protein